MRVADLLIMSAFTRLATSPGAHRAEENAGRTYGRVAAAAAAATAATSASRSSALVTPGGGGGPAASRNQL